MKIFSKAFVALFFVLVTSFNLFAITPQKQVANSKQNWTLLKGARLNGNAVQHILVVVDTNNKELVVLVKQEDKHALYAITKTSEITAGSEFTLPLISGDPLAGETIDLAINAIENRKFDTFVVATVSGFTGGQRKIELQTPINSKFSEAIEKTPYEQCVQACMDFTRGTERIYCLTGCWLNH